MKELNPDELRLKRIAKELSKILSQEKVSVAEMITILEYLNNFYTAKSFMNTMVEEME